MKKISISVQVVYSYEIEVPNRILKDEAELQSFADVEDPVYRDLCGVLSEAHLNHSAEVISITDDETGEVLYSY